MEVFIKNEGEIFLTFSDEINVEMHFFDKKRLVPMMIGSMATNEAKLRLVRPVWAITSR